MTDLTLPAFLDAFSKRLSQRKGVVTYYGIDMAICEAREDVAQHPTPALGWSEWLDWAGGPCPLPGDTTVEVEYIGNASHGYLAAGHDWSRIRRFRYICLPSGWLPRGDFIPPDVLWRDDCPVRCEWTISPVISGNLKGEFYKPGYWQGITHIRLVAREKVVEMPEGWRVARSGALVSPDGYNLLHPDTVATYGPDTIRRAVDAWLASMKERGNA